ncbi:MAG: hypothetical protein WC462_03955 [archaeon]
MISNNSFSSKGFLFTISVILFASTLVFYVQTYSATNSLNERQIILSEKPVNALVLNDDISFDLIRILGINLDLNNSDSNRVIISGDVNLSSNIPGVLTDYESFLNNDFFPRVGGDQSIDLSNLNDGVGEVFFGNSLEFDYDYSSGIYLYPKDSAVLESLDLNVHSSGSFLDFDWNGSSGSQQVIINYSDDSNSISLVKSVDLNALSSLKILYSDCNAFVYFGEVDASGSDYNSSLSIQPCSSQAISYSINAVYSGQSDFVPVLFNSVFSVRYSKVDVNSFVVLRD